MTRYIIILTGLNLRLIADAPESDIVKLPPSKINESIKNFDDRVEKLMRKLEKRTKRTSNKDKPRILSS